MPCYIFATRLAPQGLTYKHDRITRVLPSSHTPPGLLLSVSHRIPSFSLFSCLQLFAARVVEQLAPGSHQQPQDSPWSRRVLHATVHSPVTLAFCSLSHTPTPSCTEVLFNSLPHLSIACLSDVQGTIITTIYTRCTVYMR